MVETTNLDEHRGMAAQKATELRRLRIEVELDQAALRARQEELEGMLAAAPATSWPEAVEKARYLLGLFAQTPAGEDPRRRRLIGRVMADFDRLLGEPTSRGSDHEPVSGGQPHGPGSHHHGERTMARGERRGNREAKKPKQDKPKSAPPPSPFATTPGKGSAPTRPPNGKR